jgi:4-amino-4-deoxy-L-arabinose transferase-like glycosyltransferase
MKKHFVATVGVGIILLLGAVLYFYKLSEIPSGFYIDEALPGYNAYSLLLTGKDEFGKNLPMFLRFSGSFNPPLFAYLVVPSIAIFGLNIFAVRAPSALAGLVSGFAVYLLLKNSHFLKRKVSVFWGFLFFVISPWIILYSRVGYEASLAFLLFAAGCLFLWLGIAKPKRLILATIFLSLSTFAAHAERFLIPMVIVGFVLVFRKVLFRKNYLKILKISLLILLVTQIPHLILLTTPAFFTKANLWGFEGLGSFWGLLGIIREFLSRYFVYFSPRSLFFLPDPDPQRSIPGLSVFYPWMLAPYFLGIYTFWKRRKEDFSKFIILLLVLTPIPAAFTRDPFATHRALPALLPLIVVIAAGVDLAIKRLRFRIRFPLFVITLGWSLVLLWRSYFVLLPQERARNWGYGIDRLTEEIQTRPGEDFLIDESRAKPLYVNLLFFLKYPPEKFHTEVDQGIRQNYYLDTSFSSHYKFANIETRGIEWEKDIYKEQILVGDSLTISAQQAQEHFLEKVFEIKDPLGEIIFQGYRTNPTQKCASGSGSKFCPPLSTF